MKILNILIVSILLPVLASHAAAQNYSGQWLATVSESVSWCKDIGKTETGDYKLTIVQKGNDVMLMENVVQRPYKGFIDPKRPRNLHITGSYVKDGGYVNEMLDIGFDSESAGQGGSVWQWTDGYYQCGGRFKFDLKRIRQ